MKTGLKNIKQKINWFINHFLWMILFFLLFFTIFIAGRKFADGVGSGKYFWFYLSIALVSFLQD